tara:strand:+ start:248 stop:385 length:138 start_codon:yes stop_codon:yes gene_type:complete
VNQLQVLKVLQELKVQKELKVMLVLKGMLVQVVQAGLQVHQVFLV